MSGSGLSYTEDELARCAYCGGWIGQRDTLGLCDLHTRAVIAMGYADADDWIASAMTWQAGRRCSAMADINHLLRTLRDDAR